ncbi:MG2 domain-containing protein [Crenobacter sp. SG2305]|uniref:Ig-like domain-containing alpha-2-macroglobulin family protein n=1 Tax=Crenobacter oryzisoli TaxID=3056844 RepID=UPI0025AAAF2B|nr:Ig-like domain-containing alpha-2-macroglobulin family protein [Crenobacter sp. SG2305]MDN0085308.1 MG2 domain-containing protein [Crenobacter sp. SG2305]
MRTSLHFLIGVTLALAVGVAEAVAITAFSPTGEVRAPSQVRISFDSSMIRLGNTDAPPPVQWSCALKGQPHWVDDKTWVLDLKDPPSANTSCRFTIKPGLKNLQGEALPAASYAFTTGAPAILKSWPEDDEQIEEDQAFVLRTNARLKALPGLYCQSASLPERIPVAPLSPAERQTLLQHLKLDKEADHTLTVRCGQRLPPDSKLTLVNPRSGSTPDKIEYKVRPPFSATLNCHRENARGACIPFKPLVLNFSSPVPAKLASAIRLKVAGAERQPDPQGDNRGKPVDSISFAAPFPPRESATLSLPKDFKDEIGRSLTNASRFPLTIPLADFPPLAKFAAAPFGIIEAGSDAALPITLRGVEAALPIKAIQLGGQSLRVTDDKQIQAWLAKVSRNHESTIEVGKGKIVESRRLSLLNGDKSAKKLSLPTQPEAKGRWPFEVVGIPLPQPGLYVVEVSSKLLGKPLLGGNTPMYVRTAALVTNMAVHFKRSPENAAVWVTSLDRGRPMPNAEVHVYDCRGKALWQGHTDAQGVARIATRLDDGGCDGDELSGFFVTARSKDATGREDVSFVRSSWNRGIETWRFPFPTSYGDRPSILAHSVMDRTLLRPGETVSMKHFLRVQNAQGLALLKANQLPEQVRLVHNGSNDEYTLPLTWRQGRYAESSFALPAAAKLGEYSVYLEHKGKRDSGDSDQPSSPELDGYSLQSGSFRVEQFRLPTMTGRISALPGAGIAPKELPLNVSLAWGNGGPAKGWPVEVSAMLEQSYASPKGYERFSFSPPEKPNRDQADALDGKVVLDKAALKLDDNGNGMTTIKDLPKLDRRYDLVSEVAYRDPNGEVQTLSRRIPLLPAGVLLGIDVESWVSVGRTLNLKTVLLDLSGKPLANKTVTVKMVEHRYLSTRKRLVGGFYAWEHDEETSSRGQLCEGKTDARGLLLCDVALKDEGNMELIAEARDDKGNTVRAAQSVWVSHHDELWFDVDNNDRIDVLPEKTSYAPGDTARLQVRMPFRKATAWVAIEREGIVDTRVIEIEGKNPVVEVKIEPNWAPNVYVSVLAVRGRLREVPWYSFFTWGWKTPLDWWDAYWNEGGDYVAPTSLVDLSRPAFKYGIAELKVDNKANRLQVDVTPERAKYGIRETAKVQIKVRLPDGKPAPAGTEVAFAAVDEALLELQPNRSWEMLEAMQERHSYAVDTATAQLEVVGKRHYGRKALPPGGGGGKAPTRELLDTLLTWRPRVVLGAGGTATVSVPINDALTRFRLVAVADYGRQQFGTGSTTITVSQDLQLTSAVPPLVREGDQLSAAVILRNGSDRSMSVSVSAAAPGLPVRAPITLTLPAGEAREARWPITVPTGHAELAWTFSAHELKGKAADKLAIKQQVEPAVPVTVQQATLVQLEPSQSIPVGLPADAQPGRGGIRVSLQAKLGDDLPGVRRWFETYPYVCLEQRTSVALGLHDAVRWNKLMAELPLYLDSNGLAAYFPLGEDAGDRGSDVLTSYFLAVAHEAGQTLPEPARTRLLDGLTAFVEGRIKRELPLSRQDLDARRLAAMETLARYGRFAPRMLDVLNLQPQSWNTAMLIDWVSLLNRVPAIPNRAARLAEASNLLRSRLTYQGTRLAFSTERDDGAWWLMSNGDVNAARLLLAAHALPDWRADLPRLLTGLLGRQDKGHWQTTTANLWGTLAVAQFSRQFESVPVSGNTSVSLGKQRKSIAWQGDKSAALPLLPWPANGNGTLQLNHQGSGAPWATVQAEAAVKLRAPRSAGYTVKKTLTPVSQKTAGQYQPGDVVEVTLDVDAQAEMSWVVVDDPIPAGASLLGSGLGRDSAIANSGQARDNDEADYIERRFSGYRAYYSYVPRGHLKLQYRMRLNNPGSFQLPPTRVEALYAPGVFGQLPNPVFKVVDGK